MAASLQRPIYTVYVVSGTKKYNVTPAVRSLGRHDPEGQIAQRVKLELKDVKADGVWLSAVFNPRDRVYVYADDGSQKKEVFRGYLWNRNSTSTLHAHDLNYTCYDNLIYFQESQDSLYFSSGKRTKDVMTKICGNWGIKLVYSYDSITHDKLPLKGYLSDIFTADILDLVKKRTKKKYVILSDKDTMYVKPTGENTTIYQFLGGKNVTSTSVGWSMDGVITKVVIVGKADDDDREPIEATVSGNTSKYGTLQKIQDKDDNTSLADAKLEAKNTIDENGSPKWEYEITAPDIPWIRKGDKVYVDAGNIQNRYLIVLGVDRMTKNNKSEMTLSLEMA